MKIAIIGYVPPPTYGQPEAFLRNLQNFQTEHELILFSDYEWPQLGSNYIKVPSPEFNKGAEWSKTPSGKENHRAVNNLVFFTALRIAISKELTHFLYIEEDCRVGENRWDTTMFGEFFETGDALTLGGSVVLYSPFNWSMKFAQRASDFIAQHNTRKNYPIPIYGAGGAAEKREPCVLVNGALGIYNVEHLKQLFTAEELSRSARLAGGALAWDFEIGLRLVRKFDVKAFDMVRHLRCSFSSYGNILTTEGERQQLLEQHKWVAVHQIKSHWAGPAKGKLQPIIREQHLTPEEAGKYNEIRGQVASDFAGVSAPTPNAVEIFIVSFRRDLEFHGYLLKSISKFARGFFRTTVAVPLADQDLFVKQLCDLALPDMRVRIAAYEDAPPPKGFLMHEVIKCEADRFCDADYILHMDSDCIFTEPVTPQDYFQDGKPILWMEQFESFRAAHPNRYNWKRVTERALGFSIAYETMCRHPAVHCRQIYLPMRQHIERVHDMPFEQYVLNQKPDYPQGFTEFPALGAYVLHQWPDRYHFVDITGLTVKPPEKVRQFWSRGGVTPEVKIEMKRYIE